MALETRVGLRPPCLSSERAALLPVVLTHVDNRPLHVLSLQGCTKAVSEPGQAMCVVHMGGGRKCATTGCGKLCMDGSMLCKQHNRSGGGEAALAAVLATPAPLLAPTDVDVNDPDAQRGRKNGRSVDEADEDEEEAKKAKKAPTAV